LERVNYIARAEGRFTVSGAPEGYDAWLAAEAALRLNGLVVFVTPDDVRAASASDAVRFFAPGVQVLPFPAWDCLPYDRVFAQARHRKRTLGDPGRLGAPD